MDEKKILDFAKKQTSKAADMVTDRLREAKQPSNSIVFVRDGQVYLQHQNMLMGFKPDQAIILSEAMMMAGYDLKPEDETDAKNSEVELNRPNSVDVDLRTGGYDADAHDYILMLEEAVKDLGAKLCKLDSL